MLFRSVSGVPSGKEYINNETRIYIPFDTITNANPIAVQDAATGSSFSGFFQTPTLGTDPVKGNYFALPGSDLTNIDWLVGYKLNFKVTLPIFYVRQDNFVDFDAYLTIHRVKFMLGLTAQCNFLITPINQSEFNYEASTIRFNEYTYDKVPLENRLVFTVPIMQKNINFDLSVTSDNPYIVSLNSAMWEGNYSPKYYRRT